jgi:hypothetical protein
MFKPGDKIIYYGDEGTVIDWKNLIIKPRHEIGTFDKIKLEEGSFILILFDEQLYRGYNYDPYYIIDSNLCRLISSSNLPYKSYSKEELKEWNTKTDRGNCIKCGNKLKNPIPWNTIYKHCPICEP